MKFLYCQDTHIKGKNPGNRLGDYYSDIMGKIKEIISLAKKYKVDMIIHGGDVFDTEIVSYSIVDDFIDAIEKSKIPWRIVWGNHDEIGWNPELSNTTTLAHVFRRSKLIMPLDSMIKDDVCIDGYNYLANIEDNISKNGLKCHTALRVKIAVLHALITPEYLMPQISHVPIKAIKTDYDFVFVAHNHTQWGSIKHKGTDFIGLGCIGRCKINERDVKPQVVIFDTEAKQPYEIIDLKNINENPFDVDTYNQTNEFNTSIEKFISSLKEFEFSKLDICDLVKQMGKSNNVEEKVINVIIDKIGRIKTDGLQD